MTAIPLERALRAGEFLPHYQPILRNSTMRIEKYESLARLMTNQGILLPHEFRPYMTEEMCGLMSSSIIRHAHKVLEETETSIAINISPSMITTQKTVRELLDCLTESPYSTGRIVVELIEDEAFEDMVLVKEFVKAARSLGVKIAIDDFGTGHANYQRLFELEPDIIKIDGSLIKEIDRNGYCRSMVESISEFAGKQGILTVAEFIETKEVFDIVRGIGIDFSQGYFIGRPSPNLEYKELINLCG